MYNVRTICIISGYNPYTKCIIFFFQKSKKDGDEEDPKDRDWQPRCGFDDTDNEDEDFTSDILPLPSVDDTNLDPGHNFEMDWSPHTYIPSCGRSLRFSCGATEGVTEGCILRVLLLTHVLSSKSQNQFECTWYVAVLFVIPFPFQPR